MKCGTVNSKLTLIVILFHLTILYDNNYVICGFFCRINEITYRGFIICQ